MKIMKIDTTQKNEAIHSIHQTKRLNALTFETDLSVDLKFDVRRNIVLSMLPSRHEPTYSTSFVQCRPNDVTMTTILLTLNVQATYMYNINNA